MICLRTKGGEETDRIKKTNYTEAVIDELEQMRQTSIRQFYKTDMYEGEKIESILGWYDEIKKCIQTHPPEKPVKTVLVYDLPNTAMCVEYEYGESGEKPDFHFITEMST